MNYKQELINHLVNISKLNSPNVVLESVSITVPKYIIDVASNLINNSHQWYLDNATSTKTYRLPNYNLPTEFARLVIGHKSYLLFPCHIEERFPFGKDEIKMSPCMWSKYGEFIDISVVLFPSNEDWKNIYDINRKTIIKNYLRYEEEQEKLRIQLDKEQSVTNKYHIN